MAAERTPSRPGASKNFSANRIRPPKTTRAEAPSAPRKQFFKNIEMRFG
jgi:hypothetical protein